MTSEFSPLRVAGLVVGLEADTITGLDDDDPVVTWQDQSGNGYDVIAGATQEPLYKPDILNGLPVVRFDGINDEMSNAGFAALSQPNTIFLVGRMNNAEDDLAYFYDTILPGNNRHVLLTKTDQNPDDVLTYAGAELFPGVDMPKGSWHIHTVLFDGNSTQQWLDGVSSGVGNAGSMTLDGVTIGSSAFSSGPLDGDIYAYLLYDSDIGAVARGNIQQYFSRKTAISLL